MSNVIDTGVSIEADLPSIAWIEYEGASISVTRATDGSLIVNLESMTEGEPVSVGVVLNGEESCWTGTLR